MKKWKLISPAGIEIEISEEQAESLRHVEKKPQTWGECLLSLEESFFFEGGSDDIGVLPREETEVWFSEDSNNVGKHYPTKKSAIKSILTAKLEVIAHVYNEGWEPDWSDHDQGKYFVYYRYTKNSLFISWAASDDTFGSVYFKDRETAQRALDNNRELFESLVRV